MQERRSRMKKRGFTLIELLVVIAIIAMLLAILMPALSKVKKIAQRVVCGTNLKGLGTAQNVYAHDYNSQYTVQGRGTIIPWASQTAGWMNRDNNWSAVTQITVGSSLYLLVREADVSPKSFVCPAGSQKEFSGRNNVSSGPHVGTPLDIVQLWDFGSVAQDHGSGFEGAGRTVSYAYHLPYETGRSKSRYAADGQRSAAFAVMADRSPYFDDKISVVGTGVDQSNWMSGAHAVADYWSPGATVSKSDWRVKRNNAQPHDREGQNVLFADGHSTYETSADCGVMNDNIYIPRATGTTEAARRQGNFGVMGSAPFAVVNNATINAIHQEDSYLVNDAIN